MHEKWQCRIARSLGGGFSGTPKEVWGVENYINVFKPCVFFGCYGLPDFYAIWEHKGKRAVLWAGSDITHLKNNYWLDDKGEIRIDNQGMAKWLNKYCDNYVENVVEYTALKELGIKAKIVPSFLGNVNDYKVEFKLKRKIKLYSSVSGNDFKLYGWDKIEKLAEENPLMEFHLYGNTVEWPTKNKNVIVKGRVSQAVMNKEIKKMTGAIRMTEFDGCSEIIVKSALWGQHPVSLIPYPFVLSPDEIGKLLHITEPNYRLREYFINNLNKYLWNSNI